MVQLRLGSRQPLEQSLRLLADLGVTPMPGETFSELCQRAANAHPDRSRLLSAMAHHHQVLTHALLTTHQRREHLHLWWRSQRELASAKR